MFCQWALLEVLFSIFHSVYTVIVIVIQYGGKRHAEKIKHVLYLKHLKVHLSPLLSVPCLWFWEGTWLERWFYTGDRRDRWWRH